MSKCDEDISNIKQMIKESPPDSEFKSLVDGVVNITGKPDCHDMYVIMVLNMLCNMACSMRVTIQPKEGSRIPINIFSFIFAPSGKGKGHGWATIKKIQHGFEKHFMENIFEDICEDSMTKMANKLSTIKGIEFEEAMENVRKDMASLGKHQFNFSKATPAAMAQLSHLLSLMGAGGIWIIADEFMPKLLQHYQATLEAALALYDGAEAPVMLKASKDNPRIKATDNPDDLTALNIMSMSTPNCLEEGGQAFAAFMSCMRNGLARRAAFAYIPDTVVRDTRTASERYDQYIQANENKLAKTLSKKLENLANSALFASTIVVPKNVSILMFQYAMWCTERADAIPKSAATVKVEMGARDFKTKKIAGAIAFYNQLTIMTPDCFITACQIVEKSGEAFIQIMNTVELSQRLVEFLLDEGKPVNEQHIMTHVPQFKVSQSKRQDELSLAVAYAREIGVTIATTVKGEVTYYEAIALQKADHKTMPVGILNPEGTEVKNVVINFNNLSKLCQSSRSWINHHSDGGSRSDDDLKPGCEFIVLDIDGTASIHEATTLLSSYSYYLYTTKSHVDPDEDDPVGNPRFRLLLPLSHKVALTKEEFKGFMGNVHEWLPFECDPVAVERCRRWSSHKGTEYKNVGQSLNVLDHLTTTFKPGNSNAIVKNVASLNRLERWFVGVGESGKRNQILFRYLAILQDFGITSPDDLKDRVKGLNDKFRESLTKDELENTIFKSIH